MATSAVSADADTDADTDHYLVSPRHAFFFETDQAVRTKIRKRVAALGKGVPLEDKQLIVNVQDEPMLTELHDGNATAVAWCINALTTGKPRNFASLARAFGKVVVLRNRHHPNGEVWHPYVPATLASANQLQRVHDAEQERTTCLARTQAGDPIFFNDLHYFEGVDQAVPLFNIATHLVNGGLI